MICLFGLSADPPTGSQGHAGIVQQLGALYDQVWVLPVYRHTYAVRVHDSHNEDYYDRLEDCL